MLILIFFSPFFHFLSFPFKSQFSLYSKLFSFFSIPMIQKKLVSLFLLFIPFLIYIFLHLILPCVPSHSFFSQIGFPPNPLISSPLSLLIHLFNLSLNLNSNPFSPLFYLSLIMLFFFFSATLHFLPSNLSSHTLFYIPFRYLRSHNFVSRLFSFPFPKLFIFQAIFSCLLIPCISSPSLFHLILFPVSSQYLFLFLLSPSINPHSFSSGSSSLSYMFSLPF